MSLGLTIAVPRGALMRETLDLLDTLGLDTSEVRSNDRKLLFDDIGVVTMRPSDVPTYVEAGAADIGITGKDVLKEQPERDVYELLDLGFGRCEMVLATVDGPDPSVEALRRLGVMRVATKYYKTAIAYFEETGRQAEIVEVKGSVELAPLTGLVEAIVDLTATGTTLRENNLVIRETLYVSTARLIANPVSHKLKAAAIDAVLEKLRVRLERVEVGTDPTAAAAAARALAPAPESVSAVVAEILSTVRLGGDRALSELVARFDTGGADPAGSLRVAFDDLDPALLADDVRAGLEVAIANVALVADAGVGEDKEVRLPQGHRVVLREVPVRRAAIYVPGGRAPYPSSLVMGVVTARAAGVEEVVVLTPPAIDPVILGTCALCGVHEVYAMGGAHGIAALAYGTETIERADVIAGPGSLIVQEAKRQVSDSVGIDGFYGPSDVLVLADASADPRLVALDLLAQGEHGPGAPVVAVSDDVVFLDALQAQLEELIAGREHSDPAAFVLARAASLRDALAFAEAFAPEHLELVGREAERLARRVRSAGCVFVGASGATAFGDYVAGSNHSLPTGGSARFASGLSARHFRRRFSEVHVGAAATELAAAGAPIARAEGFVVHAESMEARIGDNPPT